MSVCMKNAYFIGDKLCRFLNTWLLELLEQILSYKEEICFSNNRAPPHAYREITNFLNERFSRRWIVQHGRIR